MGNANDGVFGPPGSRCWGTPSLPSDEWQACTSPGNGAIPPAPPNGKLLHCGERPRTVCVQHLFAFHRQQGGGG